MNAITVISISRSGTLHLPEECMQHLGNPQTVRVRFAKGKIRIYPPDTKPKVDLKAIPLPHVMATAENCKALARWLRSG